MRCTLRDLVIAGAVIVIAANTASANPPPPGQIVTPGPLSVTAPSTVAVNVAFSVQVTLEDASGNPITTGAGSADRVYVTVNRLGSQTLLLSGGRVTFNNLKATSTPVTILVTDPTRNLTRTLSVPGGPPASPPTIRPPYATSFTIGTSGNFVFTTTGTPAPRITISAPPGSPFLPSGVTFVDNGNGTATLAGTPATGTAGTYNLTVTASNTAAPNATQSFVLTVSGGSTLYLNDADGGILYAIDVVTGAVVRSWNHASDGQTFPIAVAGDIRTTGYGSGETGAQYSLTGVDLGGRYTLSGLEETLSDGTTDGTMNYAVGWSSGDVYSFGRDWQSPTLIFSAGSACGGITYDASDDSFWLSADRTSGILHYSKTGTYLGSFTTVVDSQDWDLALDPSDGTLWISGTGSTTFYQYSRAGVLLRTTTITGLAPASSFFSGEFRQP